MQISAQFIPKPIGMIVDPGIILDPALIYAKSFATTVIP